MPDATDPMLTTYLAGRDVPCPQCGYNLRDLPGGRCPECGDALALQLGLAEPRQATLILGLIGLSAGAGLSGLMLVFLFIVTVFKRESGPDNYSFLAINLSGLIVEGAAVVAWVKQWPRVRRAGGGVRRGLVLACWGLTLANIVVFSVKIR